MGQGGRGGDILTKTREGSSASNLQRRTNRWWKAIVNEFDGRWEVINDDTDVISRNWSKANCEQANRGN